MAPKPRRSTKKSAKRVKAKATKAAGRKKSPRVASAVEKAQRAAKKTFTAAKSSAVHLLEELRAKMTPD